MNAYFTIVLLAVILFYIVWGLGWLLEMLSRTMLSTARNPGSKSWYLLIGPGVALHESSHALGCLFTRTKVVEFKPINVTVEKDRIILGYVKYVNPTSTLKRTIINLAPVAVSLVLLTLFAGAATYLVPESALGGEAISLWFGLIDVKNQPALLADPIYPLAAIGAFIYNFLYAFSGLTVINPLFWIICFLAMTIMFSNAPSDVDIRNAATGLKFILVFDLVWLVVAYFVPQAGILLIGVFELLAVMFSLAIAFAGLAYGFFILVAGLARIKSPFQIIPLLGCVATGIGFWYLSELGTFVTTAAMQTVLSIGALVLLMLLLLMTKRRSPRT
ncbi:MAG: hypothetical protein EAX95_11645 [Candidatus Thorarchaeota archaeon]|nr:hypothetical protein [Candidatus Thorarchaeota archaeon]